MFIIYHKILIKIKLFGSTKCRTAHTPAHQCLSNGTQRKSLQCLFCWISYLFFFLIASYICMYVCICMRIYIYICYNHKLAVYTLCVNTLSSHLMAHPLPPAASSQQPATVEFASALCFVYVCLFLFFFVCLTFVCLLFVICFISLLMFCAHQSNWKHTVVSTAGEWQRCHCWYAILYTLLVTGAGAGLAWHIRVAVHTHCYVVHNRVALLNSHRHSVNENEIGEKTCVPCNCYGAAVGLCVGAYILYS